MDKDKLKVAEIASRARAAAPLEKGGEVLKAAMTKAPAFTPRGFRDASHYRKD